MPRSIIAVVIAPLAAPVLLFPHLHSLVTATSWFVFSLIICTMMAYVGMLIFGIPGYLLLRARNWTAIWIAPLLGLIVGAAMFVVTMALFGLLLGEGVTGIWQSLREIQTLKGTIWPGGITGAVVGLVFWIIARPNRRIE